MSKETREHLSALVDGEISLETSRFLVRRLGADEDLRATWSRYHLVRDCLRHQDGAFAGEDLRSRIGDAIENEHPGRSVRPVPVRWFKPAAGLAIAASVALMAIVAVGPNLPGSTQPADGLAEQDQAQPFVSPQSFAPPPYSSQASFSGLPNGNNRKMDSYLLRHYQATGDTGGKGFVTFVPIVITGSRASAEPVGASDAPGTETEQDKSTTPR